MMITAISQLAIETGQTIACLPTEKNDFQSQTVGLSKGMVYHWEHRHFSWENSP